MKSSTQDTFLIAHARRMRNSRRQQKELNPEQYKNRLNAYQKEYRLRTRYNVLTENQTIRKFQSTIKRRESNKQRQRRCRSNQTNEKKIMSKEKNRNSKRLKRSKQHLDHNNDDDENKKSTLPNKYTILTNSDNR